MSISYKTRKGLRRFGITLGVLAIVAVLIYAGWVIWVGRYITYTREGAKLDLSMDPHLPQGTAAAKPETGERVEIIYREPVSDDDNSLPVVELTSISGYYVDLADLKESLPTVLYQVEKLPAGTAVMLDMKSIRGEFYYETTVGRKVDESIDTEQMDRLLEVLHKNDLHAIARIPAFRDRDYGLHNVPQGLAKKGGKGSLWMDDKGCYWLDPTKEGTLSYLVRVIMELKSLGFDEVVFTEFCFPDTDKIIFDDDKAVALKNAAQQLVESCGTNRFFVSFYSDSYSFPLPAGNSRLYLEGVVAADLPVVVDQTVTDNPEIQLMFITEATDTRFNDYCVLRPLDTAH